MLVFGSRQEALCVSDVGDAGEPRVIASPGLCLALACGGKLDGRVQRNRPGSL